MLDKQIVKFPIIILSTPRSGSTALADHIAKVNKIVYFSEPDPLIEKTNILVKFPLQKYVLKIHARDINRYPVEIISQIKTKDCFLIRIRRKNIIDQIASDYLVNDRKTWHYEKNLYNKEIQEINLELVNLSIDRIIHSNNFFSNNNNDYDYDLDLYYENIINDLKLTKYLITPKPQKYEELKHTISNILEKSKRHP